MLVTVKRVSTGPGTLDCVGGKLCVQCHDQCILQVEPQTTLVGIKCPDFCCAEMSDQGCTLNGVWCVMETCHAVHS